MLGTTTTLASALTIDSITITAGDTLVTAGYSLDINGFGWVKGKLDSSGMTGGVTNVTVSGNWTVDPGATLTTGSSTVTFDGVAAQTSLLSGQSFNVMAVRNVSGGGVSMSDALRATTLTALPGATLKFKDGVTHTITGGFTVSGASGNLTILKSINDGSPWTLALPDTASLTYTNIRDSSISATTKKAYCLKIRGCVDSGNNTKWIFRRLFFSQ